MSDKGWTDSEIGIEYIQDFDRQTMAKANGKPRLLLLDGHNSHFTLGFINHAIAANIIVFCYPSHCTHVLQGLDVVVFAAFKKLWTKRRADWISSNHPATFGKVAWLEVWSATFTEVMTTSTIRAGFEKTGIVPFDPSVVTHRMMAPSIAHSSRQSLPVPLASPIKRVMHYQYALITNSHASHIPVTIHPSQDINTFARANDDDSIISDGDYNSPAEAV
jgi:hypothetical protein